MVLWEALDALSHQLELSKVGPDVVVVVLVDAESDADRVALIRAAVARTGAEAVEIRPIQRRAAQSGQALVQTTLDAADVVIVDCSHGTVAVPDGDYRVLYLSHIEPQTFAPHASLRRRVHALSTIIGQANSLHISDAHGTDLHVSLAGAHVRSDHGLLDAKNPIAHFPAGWVEITPGQRTVSGKVVVMPGDVNLSAVRVAASPVVLQIADDHVSEIWGESPDADVLRALFEYPDDPNAYGTAALTFGLNPGTAPAAAFDNRLLDPVLARLLAGVITLSFGENLPADRPCQQRVTLALAMRTMYIDDLPVIRSGQLDGEFAPDVYEL